MILQMLKDWEFRIIIDSIIFFPFTDQMYLPEALFYFEGISPSVLYWASVYLDQSRSNCYNFGDYYYSANTANLSTANVALYSLDSTGSLWISFGDFYYLHCVLVTFPPLDETGYITVSDNIEDVLPYPKSYGGYGDYYQDQKQRLLLELWNALDPNEISCVIC